MAKKGTPQEKYNKTNLKRIYLDVNITTEFDILNKLLSVENKAGYIKNLIRADILSEKK